MTPSESASGEHSHNQEQGLLGRTTAALELYEDSSSNQTLRQSFQSPSHAVDHLPSVTGRKTRRGSDASTGSGTSLGSHLVVGVENEPRMEMVEDILFFLSHSHAFDFNSWPNEAEDLRKAVAEKFQVRTVGPGEIIWRNGAPGSKAFLVKEGSLGLYMAESLLKTFGEGDLAGETALAATVKRVGTLKADASTTFWEISQSDFAAAVRSSVSAKKAKEILSKFGHHIVYSNVSDAQKLKTTDVQDSCTDDMLILLLTAAGEGNLEKVKKFATVERVNMADECGETALHWACHNGHAKVVRALCQAGANPTKKNNEGMTPLHWACYNGNVNILPVYREGLMRHFSTTIKNHRIVTQGMNIKDNARATPLFVACEKGHLAVVNVFFAENMGEMRTVNHQGNGLAHAATSGGWIDVLEFLRRKKVSLRGTNDLNQTILHLACSPQTMMGESQRWALVKYICDLIRGDSSSATWDLSVLTLPTDTPKTGQDTPFSQSSSVGVITPVNPASRLASGVATPAVQSSASPSMVLPRKSLSGATPLGMRKQALAQASARRQRHSSTSSTVSTPVSEKQTDLAEVSEKLNEVKNASESSERLLNIDINAGDLEGNTPLHLAVTLSGSGDNVAYDIADELLSLDADISILNHDGQTAIHRAIISGNQEVAALLVDQATEATLNTYDPAHLTPLKLARQANMPDLVEFIESRGGTHVEKHPFGGYKFPV